QVGNCCITSKEAIKYLGVMLDNRMSYGAHVEYSTIKAARIQGALSRMLPNVGGPKESRRRLLASVVTSVLLNAAPIWAASVRRHQGLKKKLGASYRLAALRVISGFRTISEEAALVLAGMIPIDILANETEEIYASNRQRGRNSSRETIKRSARQVALSLWQERWDATTKGRWTHRLIPNIQEWITRNNGQVSYQLTQFLTGHGGYRKYLYRFGHDESPVCPNCPGADEDPEHILYNCRRYRASVGSLPDPEQLVEFMCSSQEQWDWVSQLIAYTQGDLRRLENERRLREN
ncbi:hypothetical protein KR074_012324, partial [Drosophila pseudoananassae]